MWKGWDETLAELDEAERARLIALRDRFAAAGDTEPENGALSEYREDIPQLARFLALRTLWPEMIDRWQDAEAHPAGRRLVAAGADPADVAKLARTAAYETAYMVLCRLSAEGRDPEMPDDMPGWSLMETTPDDELTGRLVQSLHEDVPALDPSGRDGADLLF